MELVVVNGANNICKSVIRWLIQEKAYAKVRLIDYRPFRSSVYDFQRELAGRVVIDKRQATCAVSLENEIEGAEKLLYFTHDYLSLTADKNDFLVGTARLAQKLGIPKMVAVCPVEYDMAYSESPKSWVQLRAEAELRAFDANQHLTILNTDLVFGPNRSHVMHYMAQCAFVGRIYGAFLREGAHFRPVHQNDLGRAVANRLEAEENGRWVIRGEEDHSIKEIMNLIEKSCGKKPDHTKAKLEMLDVFGIFDEFITGITHDRNMAAMVHTFANGDLPVTGECFWKASGLSPQEKLSIWLQYHH